MDVFSVNRGLFGLFVKGLVTVALSAAFTQQCAAEAPKGPVATDAKQRLEHGLYLADLYNWADATSDFQQAYMEFKSGGDKRDSLYAHLGLIRATIERHNLPRTSAELNAELESDPLLRSDEELRMFCLRVKGDVDQEIDTRAARLDWEEVRALAEKLGNKRWENRALAQIGIAAFYDRDLETASKDVATAVEMATKFRDVGAQIRFTTVLGIGLTEAKMYERALPYFENALEIAKSAPDSGYPFFTYDAQVQALVGLKRYDDAQQLVGEMLKQISLKYRTGPKAEVLAFAAARIALARGNVQNAVSYLKQCIEICKREGYQQVEAEPEYKLAEIFRQAGDLRQAEYFVSQAAASSQASGDKWSLPARLQTLAELQTSQGKYAEADRTYDRASAFIDTGLASSSSVLGKTSLIEASGTLYPEHFALVVSRLNNDAKAYGIVEHVRGRVATDLLLSGSVGSEKAKQVERTISGLQLQLMSAQSAADVDRLRHQIFTAEESRWITPGVSILKHSAQEIAPLDRVRQSLPPSTVVLEYVVAEPKSYCLVLSRESIRTVPLTGQSRVNQLIHAYLQAVRGRSPAHVEARDLFNALLGPIREAESSHNLVIVPDGQMHLLPFDALEKPSGEYVMESHVVVYAPSATAYYLLNQEVTNAQGSVRPLLGVGGIPYSNGALRQVAFTPGISGSKLRDLPYSKEEVLDANAALSGKNELLLGREATETAFKRAVERQLGTIHLAVHGIADDPDPDNASLALLPDAAAGEDGLLHASEIAMMHLRTNLVVLSACDTAVGPTEGEEGISTLSNSFLLAGVRAVVSTLWAADDTSSLFLMQQFYSRLAAGEYPALALADSKRQMLRHFGKAALPYYWAGFTYEGILASPTTH